MPKKKPIHRVLRIDFPDGWIHVGVRRDPTIKHYLGGLASAMRIGTTSPLITAVRNSGGITKVNCRFISPFVSPETGVIQAQKIWDRNTDRMVGRRPHNTAQRDRGT